MSNTTCEATTEVQNLLGVSGETLQTVVETLKGAGIFGELRAFLNKAEGALGIAMLQNLLSVHPFPYRTLRVAIAPGPRGQQVQEALQRMTSLQMGQVADTTERYKVNDTTDWLRWAEFVGVNISWER